MRDSQESRERERKRHKRDWRKIEKTETKVRLERDGAVADGPTQTNEIAIKSKGDMNRARQSW